MISRDHRGEQRTGRKARPVDDEALAGDALFERFWRSEGGRSRGRGGAGLGLAIAASLAAAHGGELTVDTEPGRGAAFHLRLPQAETFQVTGTESQGRLP